MRITVIGGGSWGTALAHLLAGKGLDVCVLAREEAVIEGINKHHENPLFLQGIALSPNLKASASAPEALAGADVCLLAVPCQYMRETLAGMAAHIPDDAVPLCVSKGIETVGMHPMHEVVDAVLPKQAARYGVLSGPSFAREVAEGKPTTVALACRDASLTETLRDTLSTPLFRIYSSQDIIGLEIGGAFKNVIAVAAGICDGLELGYNARAGLITRGLAEMTRLGVAMGAQANTFMGLSGLGDLVLTCTGDLSRNRLVGMRMAKGESSSGITAGMIMVAEGVKTTEAVCRLGERLHIELPVAEAVRKAVNGTAAPADMVRELMTRSLRGE